MKISVLLFIVFFFFNNSFAQPDWVKNYGKSIRYSEASYLVGFGMDKLGKDKDRAKSMQRAIEYARGSLVQSIRVSIQSTVGLRTEERDEKISSYFSNATQATSSLEVQGLETQTYYDDDEEVSFALAVASREKLVSIYGDKEKKLRQEIRQRVAAAKRFEESGSKTKALDEYLDCYPIFRQLEESQAILLAARTSAIGYPSLREKAFDELENEVSQVKKQVESDDVSISAVREAVQRLVERALTSPEDIAWYLVYCMWESSKGVLRRSPPKESIRTFGHSDIPSGKEQTPLQNAAVLVTPFTYRDTKMGSPFSRFFKQLLESKASEVARWTPVQQVEISRAQTRDVMREATLSSGAQYVLRGTYWEQQGKIKFIATLQRASDWKTMSSAETIVDEAVVKKAGLSLKPQNFETAFSDQKQFNKDEVIGGGLHAEVWTNKGTEDLIFTKGERMQVYVRVNMPCYIRFIYHLADGKRTLLLDNYYIDESKVNMVVQIPDDFECDEPYGAEVLQAFARNEKFDPVETVRVDGYEILKEDLEKILSQTRGMKKVKPNTLQAETRVVMTTMEK